MLTDEEVRALERARTVAWVERKLRNARRYERRMIRHNPRWGANKRRSEFLAVIRQALVRAASV
jgi:tRNA(Ile)-lysidine synthase TilS/MesJ